MAKKEKKEKRDLYQEITDRIILSMEKDQIPPWSRPWKVSPLGSMPYNAITKRPYRGINVFLVMMTAFERNYTLPVWLSFKQANEVAAKAVRKTKRAIEQNTRGIWVFSDGEDKGKSVGGIRAGQNKDNNAGATEVVFWKPVNKADEDEDGNERKRSYLIMRNYNVFNIHQCDTNVQQYLCPNMTFNSEGELIGLRKEESKFSPIKQAENICNGYECKTLHGFEKAFYRPSSDTIYLPDPDRFKSSEEYYTTRFHEMGHSTGHQSRLNRSTIVDSSTPHHYAEEELVAEFTACFLAGEANIIRTIQKNSTAYLKHWASKLREDKKIIVNAAQRAQKATDFILGRKVEEQE